MQPPICYTTFCFKKYNSYTIPVLFKDSSGMVIPVGLYTLEFRTDGKVYEEVNDNGNIQRDTFSYQLVNEFLIRIDGEDYLINKFTNNELHTTDYYDDGTSDVEHMLEFKK